MLAHPAEEVIHWLTVPRALLRLPQVMLERPETVNALIDGYLARVMPTLGGGGGA